MVTRNGQKIRKVLVAAHVPRMCKLHPDLRTGLDSDLGFLKHARPWQIRKSRDRLISTRQFGVAPAAGERQTSLKVVQFQAESSSDFSTAIRMRPCRKRYPPWI